MSLCLTTSYDENFAVLGELAASTMRIYARRFFCSVRINPNLGLTERPHSWHRVRLIPELFDQNFDFVMWIDADALFLRFDCNVETIIQPEKDLYMVRHLVTLDHGPTLVPNFGVFLMRNCAWSRRFLSAVWEKEQYIDHVWWENAAVLNLMGYHSLLGEGEDRPNGDILWHVSFIDIKWNSVPSICTSPDPVIQHYAGMPFAQRIPKMRKDFLGAMRLAQRDRLLEGLELPELFLYHGLHERSYITSRGRPGNP